MVGKSGVIIKKRPGPASLARSGGLGGAGGCRVAYGTRKYFFWSGGKVGSETSEPVGMSVTSTINWLYGLKTRPALPGTGVA